MLRRILLILFLAFGTAGVICAQTVVSKPDSLAASQDYSAQKIGQALSVYGASACITGLGLGVVGGALLLVDLARPYNPAYEYDDMLGALLLSGAAGFAVGGIICLAAGIPIYVMGRSMVNSTALWHSTKGKDPSQTGLGIILEVVPMISAIRVRATAGKYLGRHIFLGGGVAPGLVWFNKPELSIPVYADFRWSITRGMVSPYLGLSAGIDLLEYPYEMFPQYLSAEAGFRVRLSDANTKSTWVSIFGEVGAAYANAGFKLGYSF